MSHKKKSHLLSHKPFAGSVELIPPQLSFVEFFDAHRIWGFPIQQLERFVLEENPQRQERPASPPEQLVLFYLEASVFLRGWRLELMLRPLITGRVARIHAEKHLGSLIIEEAWVSEIHVVPLNPDHRRAGQTKAQASA
ncbi:MAG TPA: hypothetical protein VH255_04455 [Verrucomicrobiae bacterium]|jgi:hypothetical protein|nr:hypothetical protein [Verrucomicrobiae bacterium]